MPIIIGGGGEATVEIAFDSGYATPAAERTWTDVSDYVEGDQAISIGYGRADEVSSVEPSRLTVTLDNRDGRFTPEKATSPYYPNVKKGRPIRVTVTYGGTDHPRFTGYIDEWPLLWPDGTDSAATVTISATSRRARLGQSALLQSAIRAAYLASGPSHYWPMTEGEETADPTGRQTFRDLVAVNNGRPDDNAISAFSDSEGYAPVVGDGTAGPIDEESLVQFPDIVDTGLIGTLAAYVGASGPGPRSPSDGLTVEVVGRWATTQGKAGGTQPIELRSDDLSKAVVVALNTDSLGYESLSIELMFRDSGTSTILEDAYVAATSHQDLVDVDPTSYTYSAATSTLLDGRLHHFAVTLEGGTDGALYYDGVLVAQVALASRVLDVPLTKITTGTDTWGSTAWSGHLATTGRVLTGEEIATHAAWAGPFVSETVAERLDRIVSEAGVDPAEADTEDTTTAMGPQPQAGRSAVEVLDEMAAATGGVAYDQRDGTLYIQGRGHRYNATPVVTLDATLQDVGSDLAPVLDDRYLINRVEVTSLNSDLPTVYQDDSSQAEYGLYVASRTVISADPRDAESLAWNELYRHAVPRLRVSAITVDVTNVAPTKQAALMAADIGSRIAVENLPDQAPTDPLYLFVEGYAETISYSGHSLTFNTTPGDLDTAFTLDDATLGVLDSDAAVIAF